VATQIPKQSRKKNGVPTQNHALGHLFGESTKKSNLDADWNQVQPSVLLAIVWAVNQFGGATTFSTTRKGNAYCIKVYLGAPYDPLYFDGDDEGRAAMQEWADNLVAAAAEHA